LNKLKQIAILSILGFLLIQAAKATGVQVDTMVRPAPIADTAVKESVPVLNNLAVNDPKLGFKNLFATAITGDGINGAKLNPMAISFVQNYINKNSKGFLEMKDWAKGYFNMMDEVLTQHGLPKELKYLAVIESGLKLNVGSRSGATGPWAFMPAAAKEYGLRISKGHDDRLDYYKSTHAAARLLTDLYAKYGDWLLVIAAYNSGPGFVDKAIKKTGGSKDFWTLQYLLPNETMNHVKKFIGTHYIFEGEGGITTVTKDEAKDIMLNNPADLVKEEMDNSTVYKITGRFSSSVIIKYVEMDMATFMRYNPRFDNEIAVNGKYDLRLPTPKMNIFVSKRYEILDESVQALLKAANGTR
jgi:membrane-bound lytic murein transglycosylase D